MSEKIKTRGLYIHERNAFIRSILRKGRAGEKLSLIEVNVLEALLRIKECFCDQCTR